MFCLQLSFVENYNHNSVLLCHQDAEKEAKLAKEKKTKKAERKKQAKNKNKPTEGKPTRQNGQPPQTEVRPYTRTRPIGQTSKQDESMDQSAMGAPADNSSKSDVRQPAVYVRGQKRKVSKWFSFTVVAGTGTFSHY